MAEILSADGGIAQPPWRAGLEVVRAGMTGAGTPKELRQYFPSFETSIVCQ